MKCVREAVGHYMKTTKTILMFAMENTDSSDNRRIPMLGIAYLQAALQNQGYYCERIDPFVNDYVFEKEKIVNYIINNNYDVVGFSVLECNIRLSLEMAKMLKNKKRKIKIIFGGMYATIKNAKLLNNDYIDVVMLGEGEDGIVELVNDIEDYGDFKKIVKGCSYKNLNGKKHICNDVYYLKDMNKNVFPNRDNFDKYSKMEIDGVFKYLIPISSSRGCPYNCAFCSVSMLKSRWRPRTPENVLEEIKSIYNLEKNIVVIFIDDNFFVNIDRSIKIMEGLHELNIKFTFATRVNQIILAETKLNYIKELGCISIELGIENGSNAMLNRFNKHTTVEENKKAIKLLRKVGIEMAIDYIMFDNETSIDELKENIQFLKDSMLWGTYPTFFYNKVYPYDGTAYYSKIDKKNYFKYKEVELIASKFFDFAINYQPKLNYICDYLRGIKHKTRQQILDEVFSKTAPYMNFEYLVNNNCLLEIEKLQKKILELFVLYGGQGV